MTDCPYEITENGFYQCTHPKNKIDKNTWFSSKCGTFSDIKTCVFLNKAI